MGGLHWYDLIGLILIGLVIFGPKKLPEMGSSLGKTIREFQKSMREVTNPEPPSSVPPSAPQPSQIAADATPAVAPAAPVVEASADASEERADQGAEIRAETGVEASAEPKAEPSAATLVGEDSVR